MGWPCETDLLTVTVPANSLWTNNSIVARLYFTSLDSSNADPDTYVIKEKYWATTVVTSPTMATGSNGVGNYSGFIDVLLCWAWSTSSQKGLININSSRANTAGSTDSWSNYATWTSAEDSTASKTFTITFKWTNTNGTATMEMATVQLLQ